MKHKRIALALLSLALLGVVRAESDPGINFINMFIRLDDQRAYGLHKLNTAERGRLNEVFGRIVAERNDNLRNSALAYLKEAGWAAIELTGTEQLTLDPAVGEKTYVAARWLDARLTLEPLTVSTLMPGNYLGRVDSTVCRILDPQGKPVEFLIRRTGLPGTDD